MLEHLRPVSWGDKFGFMDKILNALKGTNIEKRLFAMWSLNEEKDKLSPAFLKPIINTILDDDYLNRLDIYYQT